MKVMLILVKKKKKKYFPGQRFSKVWLSSYINWDQIVLVTGVIIIDLVEVGLVIEIVVRPVIEALVLLLTISTIYSSRYLILLLAMLLQCVVDHGSLQFAVICCSFGFLLSLLNSVPPSIYSRSLWYALFSSVRLAFKLPCECQIF